MALRFCRLAPVWPVVATVLLAPLVAAQPRPGDAASVSAVRFESVRGPGGSWLATVVDVEVRPAAGSGSRYVDRVQVALQLGFEVGTGAARRFQFYRAAATAVTIEQGRASFRFYLPPEIVERDRITGGAPYFVADVLAAGREQPLARPQAAPSLANAEALARFRARVAAEAGLNDGILRPQDQSPFATASGGPPAPTFLPPP